MPHLLGPPQARMPGGRGDRLLAILDDSQVKHSVWRSKYPLFRQDVPLLSRELKDPEKSPAHPGRTRITASGV